MKFNVKYRDGDIKRKLKFAFIPTKIENTLVWLEYYVLIKKYCQTQQEGDFWIEVGAEICDNELQNR